MHLLFHSTVQPYESTDSRANKLLSIFLVFAICSHLLYNNFTLIIKYVMVIFIYLFILTTCNGYLLIKQTPIIFFN